MKCRECQTWGSEWPYKTDSEAKQTCYVYEVTRHPMGLSEIHYTNVLKDWFLSVEEAKEWIVKQAPLVKSWYKIEDEDGEEIACGCWSEDDNKWLIE